jgi:hypothetical protein
MWNDTYELQVSALESTLRAQIWNVNIPTTYASSPRSPSQHSPLEFLCHCLASTVNTLITDTAGGRPMAAARLCLLYSMVGVIKFTKRGVYLNRGMRHNKRKRFASLASRDQAGTRRRTGQEAQ